MATKGANLIEPQLGKLSGARTETSQCCGVYLSFFAFSESFAYGAKNQIAF